MNTSLLRILGLGLSLLWATTGCRHTGPVFTTDAAIEVTPNIDPAQQAATTRTATTVGASKTGFGATDEFGVWVLPYLNSDANKLLAAKWEPKDNYADNVLFASDGAKFAPKEGQVYYPSPKTLVDLYGVYPYNATMSNQEADLANNSMPDPAAFAFSIAQDQTNATSVVASDLMTSKTEKAQQGAAIAMAFTHRLSRVLVAFTVPEHYRAHLVNEVLRVEVRNIPLKAVVDLSNTATAASAATTGNAPVDILAHQAVRPEPFTTVKGDYVYEAIVMPGTVIASGENIVRITLDVADLGEVVFDCKFMGTPKKPTHTYEAKQLTQINVTIGAETTIELDKDQVTIAQWGKMTEIAGSTSKLSKMWFAYEDTGNAWPNALKCDAATLIIEGETFQATKVQYVAGAFLIEYDHGTNAGGYLEQITLQTTDKATILLNVVLKSDIDPKSRGYQIKGDPTMSNYDKKIGKITVTGANTAKVDPITK